MNTTETNPEITKPTKRRWRKHSDEFKARVIGIRPATLILGTSPGGIAEMAITAKLLQLGVPVATAFQVCRLVAVLILAEPLYRWLGPQPQVKG